MSAIVDGPQELAAANEAFVLRFSEIDNRQDTAPKPIELGWGVFCARFSEPDTTRGELSLSDYQALDVTNPADKQTRDSEKDGHAWLPASFTPEGRRVTEDVESITAFVGDCDDGQITLDQIRERLHGIEHFAHTTFSHSATKHKARFIVPFCRPIPPEQLVEVFEHFNVWFDGHLDPVGKKAAQLYYKPSCPFDAEGAFQFHRGAGVLFDPNAIPHRNKGTPPAPAHQGLTTITRLGRPTQMPRPCRDGERNEVALAAIGRWIKQGYSVEEVLSLAREWNANNIDVWPDEKIVAIVDSLSRADQRNHPERHAPAPWDDIELPTSYSLSLEGVWHHPDDPKKSAAKLCGPAWVSGMAKDSNSSFWGTVVEWIDRAGNAHRVAIPAERFHEQGNVLAQDLARDGLAIVPGREKQVAAYLGSFPNKRYLHSVRRLGWLDDANGQLGFVLPTKTYCANLREDVIFQPERHSPTAATLIARGTLEQWQQEVACQVRGNLNLVFSLCLPFAGPLMKALSVDSGGFHLYGRSSHGKTTAAQVAASIWGCGADPASDPELAYIQRWNTTHNGLEGLASAHNDGLMILDEIGTCAAKDFGRVIYDLAGGRGKVAMGADRNLKPTRAWRVLFLSTGEVSARQKMEEEGNTPKAGQMLRMMDIPIDNGIVQDAKGQPPAEFVNRLKAACSSHFGTAGPAFLEVLVQSFPDFDSLRRFLAPRFEQAVTKLTVSGLGPEQARAIRRLALVLVAGELAVDWAVIPVNRAEILEAVEAIRDAWLRDLDILPDAARGVESVRAFILRNPGRFRPESDSEDERPVRDLAGYIDSNRRLYLFTPQGLREALPGHDIKAVCRELLRQDLLFRNDKNHFTSKHRVEGVAERLSLYAVRFEILEADRQARNGELDLE